ncbi:hypothetical protein EH244_28650 [Variovorax beijingensis]|uniref:Uncharacterized protein n=1 Tax=Variovorax beijingensis TaxID=2496117 RepID=A0A3P3E553_9BURK|nr:hypothetical protein [Variovorax beijingensis]RRH81605.1 hypothetical protein EH244_28650 [Variovorax beijingensis]RSZ30581.1 hypothetical protein EJO66_26315 [Variovorax beijingensis]
MQYRTFKDAGWNQSLIENLSSQGCSGIEISGRDTTEFRAKEAAFTDILKGFEDTFQHPNYWILSGHETAQPNTKVVAYKKFWQSTGILISAQSTATREWCVQTENGPKFFGVASKTLVTDGDLFRLWESLKTTWLVASPSLIDIDSLSERLSAGWDADPISCPSILLKMAVDLDSVLVRSFGPTAENQRGVVAIGKDTLIDALINWNSN